MAPGTVGKHPDPGHRCVLDFGAHTHLSMNRIILRQASLLVNFFYLRYASLTCRRGAGTLRQIETCCASLLYKTSSALVAHTARGCATFNCSYSITAHVLKVRTLMFRYIQPHYRTWSLEFENLTVFLLIAGLSDVASLVLCGDTRYLWQIEPCP